MRRYAPVRPRVWTRDLRQLRGKPQASLVYLYLLTAPESTMCGLFWCEVSTVARHTGLDDEAAQDAATELDRLGLAHHDHETGVWYVPETARQLGKLKPKDAKRKTIVNLVRELSHSVLAARFIAEHGGDLGVASKDVGQLCEAPSTGPRQLAKAPSGPPRGPLDGASRGSRPPAKAPSGTGPPPREAPPRGSRQGVGEEEGKEEGGGASAPAPTPALGLPPPTGLGQVAQRIVAEAVRLNPRPPEGRVHTVHGIGVDDTVLTLLLELDKHERNLGNAPTPAELERRVVETMQALAQGIESGGIPPGKWGPRMFRPDWWSSRIEAVARWREEQEAEARAREQARLEAEAKVRAAEAEAEAVKRDRGTVVSLIDGFLERSKGKVSDG